MDGWRLCVREIRMAWVQGSIMGPFLFDVFSSQLQEIISPCKVIAYADDAYVIGKGMNEIEIKLSLERTVGRHFEWLNNIRLVYNQSKTELINCREASLTVIKIWVFPSEHRPSDSSIHWQHTLRWEVTGCDKFPIKRRQVFFVWGKNLTLRAICLHEKFMASSIFKQEKIL